MTSREGRPEPANDAASLGSRAYTSGGVSEQIIVKNLSVLVHETDEGVVVDIYPLGEEGVDDPFASTYAFFNDDERHAEPRSAAECERVMVALGGHCANPAEHPEP